MKCLVKDCPNDSSQGVFKGELCSPCHNFLKGEDNDKFMPHRILGKERYEQLFQEVLENVMNSVELNPELASQ